MSASKLELRIFDGSRQPFSAPANFLVTIIDGNQNQLFRDDITSNVNAIRSTLLRQFR